MKIERKDIDEVSMTLTMEVEKADYQDKVEKTLRDYRKKVNMPGFRPGMVPLSYVKKLYGPSAQAEELNRTISDSLLKYIQDNKLKVLGDPLPSETEKADVDLNSDKPAKFVFDVAIAPEFTAELNGHNTLTQYEIAIDDKMMDDAVKQYTSRFGSYDAADAVEENDLVKGDVVAKEGGMENKGAVISPKYIKDADTKALFIGKKKGDKVVFNPHKAMESDNEIASFLKIDKSKVAEADKDFELTIAEVTRFKDAEMNQDLFDKAMGKDTVKSEAEFRDKIKEELKKSLLVDSEYKLAADCRAAVLKKMDGLKFPEDFLKRWVKASNKDKEIKDEDLNKEFPEMLKGLKWQLAMNQIAEKNNLKVEQADLLEYGKKVARAQFAQYGMMSVPDDVADNYAKSMLKDKQASKNIFEKVLEEKVVNVLKSAAKLAPKEISLDEFNKLVGE